MDPLILHGRRWGSIWILVLTAPPAALLLWAASEQTHFRGLREAGIFAVFAVVMLLSALDSLLKAVRPNRLRLTSTGLTLETVYGAKSWTWDQYAGLHGWWHRVLILREKSGRSGGSPSVTGNPIWVARSLITPAGPGAKCHRGVRL